MRKSADARPVSSFLYDLPLRSHICDCSETGRTTGCTTGGAIKTYLRSCLVHSHRDYLHDVSAILCDLAARLVAHTLQPGCKASVIVILFCSVTVTVRLTVINRKRLALSQSF